MRKALISPIEPRLDNDGNSGYRVAFVGDEEFEVASPLFWVECPDDCVQDFWVYVNNVLVKLVSDPQDVEDIGVYDNKITF
jgi:hypothetical protein